MQKLYLSTSCKLQIPANSRCSTLRLQITPFAISYTSYISTTNQTNEARNIVKAPSKIQMYLVHRMILKIWQSRIKLIQSMSCESRAKGRGGRRLVASPSGFWMLVQHNTNCDKWVDILDMKLRSTGVQKPGRMINPAAKTCNNCSLQCLHFIRRPSN